MSRRRNRRKHRGGSVVGSQAQSSQQQPINQEGEQSTQKQPNRAEQNHDCGPQQASVAGESNSPPVVSENLPRLAVGAQGQSSQPPTTKKEGEQSPQEQSNGAAQSHGPGPRQTPVTGASKPSPHIPENQPRSVGASNSHDQQNDTRNNRGHHPTAIGQGETTETDDNGCGGCGGTACLAGAFEGLRVLSDAEAIPCLMNTIDYERSRVGSLGIALLNEQQKSRKMERELLGEQEKNKRMLRELLDERQKNMGLEGDKSNLLALGERKDIQFLQARVALRDRIFSAEKDVKMMESERKALDIKLQEMGSQLREKEESEKKVRVQLETAKSQVQQKEERERALIKEREEATTGIKREHGDWEGQIQTALIEMERKLYEKEESGKKVRMQLEAAKSQAQQKEERERALIKEKEEEITKIKRKHQEREGEILTAMTEMERKLCEKEESGKEVRVQLEAAKSLVQQKEEREGELIKEKEEEITKIKREHEEREGEIWAAMTEMERKLCEKEERGKKVRVQLEAAKGLVQQKEERERALIKEKEEEITKIKREHEEREGEIQAVMTEMESQLREKEERERAIVTEREEISKIKREHEERERQLREKEQSGKKVETELGEANEKIGRMKRDYELKLEEAKKRIDTLELKQSKLRAAMDEESDQTSGVWLETMSEVRIGHRTYMNEGCTHDQVGNDQMDWTSDVM